MDVGGTEEAPQSERVCAHDSTRSSGALDDHCLLCGKEGYWVSGLEFARLEPHRSGKVLIVPVSARV